jgi:hypothetical protein
MIAVLTISPVFHVLQHLRGTKAPGDFFSMVDDGSTKLEPAVKLLQVYGKEGDRALLRDFYYQDDRWLDGALLSIEEAGETDVGSLLLRMGFC